MIADGAVEMWGAFLAMMRFSEWRILRYGRKFAIGPYGAVFKIFLFPDGHRMLQRIDCKAAGFKRGRSMRRADRNEHAGFADFQTPEAVRHGYPVNLEFCVHLGGYLAHFSECHRFVGFVVQV